MVVSSSLTTTIVPFDADKGLPDRYSVTSGWLVGRAGGTLKFFFIPVSGGLSRLLGDESTLE